MNNFNEIINKLNEDEFSLILRCLLDRIPIVIIGSGKDNSEFFANKLIEFISFRNKLIFYTDFISKEELDIILEEEEINYDVNRIMIICPNEAVHKALQIFTEYKSWIICIHLDNNGSNNLQDISSFENIINILKMKIKTFLVINNSSEHIKIQLIGLKFKSEDLKLEKLIFNKSIIYVENSINRMKRIFSQRINSSDIKNELKYDLLNFNFEENNLKNSIFKIKILEFHNAARRAFSILNKIKILNTHNINIQISDKTILDTILYTDASFKRIIEFIQAEWNENFEVGIESKDYNYKEDLIESLWG